MAIPITDPAAAVIEFNRLALPTECPALAAGEADRILAKYKRGSLWVASTVYELGAVVIPTLSNRNGHRFIAVRYAARGSDQKSGTTEPIWGTGRESSYTDGNVVWREDGWDWDAVLWDFRGAAEEAWTTKAGQATGDIDFQTPSGMSVKASQLREHCEAQAKRFRTVSVA
jgi:hypothetical protein